MNLFSKMTLYFGLSVSLQAAPFLVEGFASLDNLPGWVIVNNSTPGGATPEGWFQGTGIFAAQAGSPDSYAQANFENAGDPGDISTWLLTPVLTLRPQSVLRFWTVGEDVPGFPDRLEVRLSTSGDSTNVGSAPFSAGDFTTLLLSINPAPDDAGYPTVWTEYGYAFSALNSPVEGRIGFRYFVLDNTVNGSTIGLDSVSIIPEPTSGILLGAGLGFFFVLRNRRKHKREESL